MFFRFIYMKVIVFILLVCLVVFVRMYKFFDWLIEFFIFYLVVLCCVTEVFKLVKLGDKCFILAYGV